MSFILLALHPRWLQDGVSPDVYVERGLNMLSLVDDDANRRSEADFAHSLAYEEIDVTHGTGLDLHYRSSRRG